MRMLEHINTMTYSSSASIHSNLNVVIFMVFSFSNMIYFFYI